MAEILPFTNHLEMEDRQTCWVCFGTDDDFVQQWLHPCKCSGTAKHVHVRCLQRWIDEKQKDNPMSSVNCPQCSYEYNIVYPKMGLTIQILDIVERYINVSCPFVAGGIFLGSLYWTAVTYSAVTVMQVLGHKEGVSAMEQADPLFLLIGLPAIPLGLVLAKLVRWEECVLKLWRKHSQKFPLFGSDEITWEGGNDVSLDRGGSSYFRVLVGAMVFPTVATLVGKLCFSSVKSNLQRSILGGITFFGIKGILKMYYMQQNFKRRAQRRIENYGE